MVNVNVYGRDFTDIFEHNATSYDKGKDSLSRIIFGKVLNFEKIDEAEAMALSLDMIKFTIQKLSINTNKHDIKINYCDLPSDIGGEHFHTTHTIKYNYKNYIKSFENGNFGIMGLSTISHELAHEAQSQKILNNSSFDLDTYINVISFLARTNSEKYYKDRYCENYSEVQARVVAWQLYYDFLKTIIDPYLDRRNVLLRAVHTGVNENINKDIGLFLNSCYKGDFLTKTMHDLASAYIKKNPLCLLDYPILSANYKIDGSEKTLEEIMYEFDNIDPEHRDSYSDLYKFIMLSKLNKSYDGSNMLKYKSKDMIPESDRNSYLTNTLPKTLTKSIRRI